MSIGIYFHIPFCLKKCGYCDFYSFEPFGDITNRYAFSLINRLYKYPSNIKVDTIYFGGGTPSILTCEQISRIISACYEHFSVSDNAEISMESNPKSADEKKLAGFLEAGITRLSVGIQSLNDAELRRLGRAHSASQAQSFVIEAYNLGFRNISCDIMLGIPEQTKKSLNSTLFYLCELPINHISAYMLKIEKNTPFFNMKNALALPDEDEICTTYLETVEFLASMGFEQYEISNFAKSGFECRHNLKYWRCEEYIGIGASAHSFFNGKRYAAENDADGFLNNHDIEYIIDDGGSQEEKIMLGLRLSKGVPIKYLPHPLCQKFISLGLMLKIGDNVRLTPKGFLVSNEIIASLLT